MSLDADTIDALIEELLTNPKVDYTIGDKTVKKGQIMTQVLRAREAILKTPVADQEVISFDALNIDEFGTDITEFV